MMLEELRKLYWHEPFEPFHLMLNDGREIPVAERQHMALPYSGGRLAVAARIEDFELIDLPDIADIRFTGQPTTNMSMPH